MGFIQNTTTTSLQAYLTPTGRRYLVDGNKTDIQIEYFSLSDPDVNYLQASQPLGNDYNVLPSGYVPDIAGGMGDTCLNGVAGGIAQNYTIKGGSAVGQIGTSGKLGDSISLAGFSDTTQTVFLNKRTTGYQLLSFAVPVQLFGQNPIGTEGVKVFVLPSSQGTSNDLYHAISTDGIVQWGFNDSQQKVATININLNKPLGSYRGKIALKLVPYKSILHTDAASSIMIVDVRINITNPSSGSGSAGDSTSGSGSVFSLGFPNN